MDICTIMQFRHAITNADYCLRRYAALRYDHETLRLTKYFAECRADYFGKSVMTYAPITPQAMELARRAITILPSKSRHIGQLRIFPEEMLCTGMKVHRCSIVVEHIPEGTLLSEAMYTHSRSHLMHGLEQLRQHIDECNISINHLHPDNIIVDGKHEWHVIRPYYATADRGNDTEAFEKLKELIERYALADIDTTTNLACEEFASYSCNNSATDSMIYDASEGLRRFTTTDGTGFMDEQENIVIEATFHSATDFLEDRAIVTLHNNKMGIIDRKGNYIIKPLYDTIDFDVDDGMSIVTLGYKSAKFDYFGTQLTPWK